MKTSKSLFGDLKTAVLILVLTGLILASGFITSKTLVTEPSTEKPTGLGVNASSGESGVKANSGDAGVSSRAPTLSSGNPDVTVWVNTKSGIYHCPNTRWYGNTKNGKYMTQKEAQLEGYQPAYGILCG